MLSKCEDGLPPRPKKETKATLRSQLGDIDEIFSSFEWQPIACASIAQVHVAHLRATGEKVAVKVQHKYARVRAEQVCYLRHGRAAKAMYALRLIAAWLYSLGMRSYSMVSQQLPKISCRVFVWSTFHNVGFEAHRSIAQRAWAPGTSVRHEAHLVRVLERDPQGVGLPP